MTQNTKSQAIEKEILFGFLPVLEKERVYGYWDYIAVQVCFGIAAWAFLTGSFMGYVVNAREVIPIALLGTALPCALMAFTGILFSRYGVDQFLLPRATLGPKGNLLVLFFWIPINWGWIAYASFLFGESTIKLLAAINAPFPAWLVSEWPGATIWALVAYWLGFWPAWKGPLAVKWFTRLGAPLLTVVLLGLIFNAVFVVGLKEIFTFPPVNPYEGLLTNRAYAIEWAAGLSFGWAFYYGQWSRLAKTETAAYHGPFWGWGPIIAIAVIFAAFTMLITGDPDPSAWMISVGGTAYGVLALAIMAVANITSITVLIYSQSIPVKYTWPKMSWLKASLVSAPGMILFFKPVFDNFNVFLTLVGVIWTVYPAVLFSDFILLKKGKFNFKQLYLGGPKYRYFNGWNLIAMAMFPIGFLFYLMLNNPLGSYVETLGIARALEKIHFFPQVFNYTTGLVPTFIFIMALYYVTMRIFGSVEDTANHIEDSITLERSFK